MPIYAYRCEACGHAQDVLQKISDPLLTQCPKCGAPAFKKQVTAAGFQLKGSGWYVTDFRGGSSSAAPPTSEAGAPKSESSKGEGASASSGASSSSGESSAAPAATPAASPPPSSSTS